MQLYRHRHSHVGHRHRLCVMCVNTYINFFFFDGEYERLKELEQIDFELVQSFRRSMDDLKAGRVRRVK
ncbi:hypothetical protein HYV82_01540 [Candidatus Woesearchaeota archaeon]|nr:hypothetical protein [Candidatus Woesearchaeota archaeon]